MFCVGVLNPLLDIESVLMFCSYEAHFCGLCLSIFSMLKRKRIFSSVVMFFPAVWGHVFQDEETVGNRGTYSLTGDGRCSQLPEGAGLESGAHAGHLWGDACTTLLSRFWAAGRVVLLVCETTRPAFLPTRLARPPCWARPQRCSPLSCTPALSFCILRQGFARSPRLAWTWWLSCLSLLSLWGHRQVSSLPAPRDSSL